MEQRAQSRVIEILLVEDNAGDVRLTKEALRESTVNHRLHIVNNGLEAMDFLHRKALMKEFLDPPSSFLI